MSEITPTDVEKKREILLGIWNGQSMAKGSLWAADIHSRITLHGFDGKVVTFRYVVDKADCNLMGTLHGGAIATMADNLTTYAAIIEDRHLRPGVSVTLEVDYMRAPKAGEVVLIECKLDKTGAYLSFSSADFLTEKRELIAKAKHVKFLGKPLSPSKL
jgi:acyl-coenzyme A thioesterase 13